MNDTKRSHEAIADDLEYFAGIVNRAIGERLLVAAAALREPITVTDACEQAENSGDDGRHCRCECRCECGCRRYLGPRLYCSKCNTGDHLKMDVEWIEFEGTK
jgi:hypothetical protein